MDPATSTDGSRPAAESAASRPLLIVGAPRSGTTWLQRLLLAHPGCAGGQESHLLVLFDRMIEEARRKLDFDRPHGPLTLLSEDALVDSLRQVWNDTQRPILAADPEARVLVEKTPDHALHLPLARRMFPECRVVHLVRHPADVVASLLRASREPWGRDWAPGSVESASRRWLECVDAAACDADAGGPDRHVEIRYEALREDPERELSSLLDFAGLPRDEETVRRIVAEDRAGRGAPIRLAGEAGDRPLEEPESFGTGESTPPLGRRDRRRCLAITGHRLERFGYAAAEGS